MRGIFMWWLAPCAALAALAGTAACGQWAVESNVQPRTVGGKSVASERGEQEALFNYYLRDRRLTYETRLAALKTSASVPTWRIPYSGWIYPQSSGGMSSIRGARSALDVYDRAFRNGDGLANAYESQRVLGGGRPALFVGLRMRRANEGWEGYCSGLTGASIRHPESIHPVDAGRVGGAPGVVFQPADIKALLANAYNRTTDDSFLYLAPPSARDGGPNMGTFHLALANYIGQAGHPIGIDRTKGRAPWNNPIYAYEVTALRDAGTSGSVHLKLVDATITYSYYSSDWGQQTDAGGEVRGNQRQSMALRYVLGLDDDGRIVGGTALSDAGYFLWLPLYAIQGKADGSVPGNPYLDVGKVLALARASADPETQKKFDAAIVGSPYDPLAELRTDRPAATAPGR